MTQKIDLNADMGESFGPWKMGNDAALLDVISSANIACGFHAGDWDVMAQTMRMAQERGVRIGCHPGFPDLQGFGRQRMSYSHDSLRNMIGYQLGASLAMARSVGGEVGHFKLHGALANMASEDEAMARACYEVVRDLAPEITVFVLAATAQQRAAEAVGVRWAGEIFADRAYNDDATLVDRRLPGAVIHDATEAAERILAMIDAGAIISAGGTRIPTRIDTVCLHGDTAEAVEIARSLRARLMGAGIEITWR